MQLFDCFAGEDVLTECLKYQCVSRQAQAPKLKTDVLRIESELKKRCDAAVVGDYTLWTTGPEAALDMLRVSTLENTACCIVTTSKFDFSICSRIGHTCRLSYAEVAKVLRRRVRCSWRRVLLSADARDSRWYSTHSAPGMFAHVPRHFVLLWFAYRPIGC